MCLCPHLDAETTARVTRDNRISCKLLYQWTSKLRSLDSSEERDGATAVNNSETGVEVRIRKYYILTMTTEFFFFKYNFVYHTPCTMTPV